MCTWCTAINSLGFLHSEKMETDRENVSSCLQRRYWPEARRGLLHKSTCMHRWKSAGSYHKSLEQSTRGSFEAVTLRGGGRLQERVTECWWVQSYGRKRRQARIHQHEIVYVRMWVYIEIGEKARLSMTVCWKEYKLAMWWLQCGWILLKIRGTNSIWLYIFWKALLSSQVWVHKEWLWFILLIHPSEIM
jgi:hypothetical protein